MKTRLFNNLLFKILSVLSAILLWLIVVNIDDPVTSREFRNVKVSLVNTEAITSQNQTYRIEEGTDTVTLKVYARRRSVLDKLKASDFEVTADMQKNLRYKGMVKIEVRYTGNYTIDHVEQSRENVEVSIEESLTEQFKVSVRTKGEPSDGLVKGSAVPEQTLVEITGPKSVVNRIKNVVAEVDITGITGTTVRTCRLKLLNGDGDEIDGTYLNYAGKDRDFDVTVTTLNKKLVGISFDISQVAPEGYELAAIAYKPETVTIAGVKSQIASIFNLSIPPEALNPNRQTGDLEQTVDISSYLPEGIVIPQEDEREIVVTMEIQPHETAEFVFQPGQIHFVGIQEGLVLDMSGSAGLTILVSGASEPLGSLETDSVQLTADLSEYTRPGVYTVPVEAVLPEGLSCPDDLKIQVTLAKAEEE